MKKILVFLSVLLLFSPPVLARTVTLQELQDLPPGKPIIDSKQIIEKNHWAYKTLENISKRYGLLIGKPGEQFDDNKPLTRKEAAVILVNLTGKIEQDNLSLSDAEKAQMDILRQELNGEIQSLAGRVSKLENSVESLKGSISKMDQKEDSKAWRADFGEKFKLNGVLQARYNGNIKKDPSYPSNFSVPIVDLTFSGQLHKHLKYVTTIFPSRTFDSTARGLLGDAYVATDIVPHHNFYLGQTRIPIGQEGTQSPYTLDTVLKSQISRKLSDFRDTGIKVSGSWPMIDYFAGAYNGSGINTTDTNTAMEYAGWAVLKPLYKYPKFGKLELGGGYDIGKTTYSNLNYGFYGGYNYKKYAIKAECATKEGYLAHNRKADGWYVHNSYFLTPKIQVVGRYDSFNPNHTVNGDDIREYTGGVNYYLSNQNLKLQLNMVYVDYENVKDGVKIMAQTQFKF